MAVVPIISQSWDTSSYVTPTRMNNIETNIATVSKATGVKYAEGVSVKDKIDSMPLNAWAIVYGQNVSSTTPTTVATTSGRSLTKYPCLAFTFVKAGIARDTILMPSDLFASGTNVDLSYVGGANDRHSLTVSYVSDTSVSVSADQNNSDYKLFVYALAPSTTF